MSATPSGSPVACAYAWTKRTFPADVACSACSRISGLASTPMTSSARSAQARVDKPGSAAEIDDEPRPLDLRLEAQDVEQRRRRRRPMAVVTLAQNRYGS